MSSVIGVQERLMTLIKARVVSEKSTLIGDKHKQEVFEVVAGATKQEIKAAVELLYKVQVKAVRVANIKGKQKKFGRFMGKRNLSRKAYVSLKPGQEINFEATA